MMKATLGRPWTVLALAGAWTIGCAHIPTTTPEAQMLAGDPEKPAATKRVIILCTGNSCRSQMAEAFWRRQAGDRWEVVSAGTRPSGRVHPLAIRAMAEKGIDISGYQSKSLQPYLDQDFDLVITVCSDADENCPHFPNAKKRIHHGFDDPPKAPGDDEAKMRVARRVRDEIEAKVSEWIATESGAPSPQATPRGG